MSKIYIANVSQQQQIVNCRVPEMTSALSRTINAGSQVSYGGSRELNTPQIEAIIRTISAYGAVAMIDTASDYVSLVYNLDKPISEGFIRRFAQRNIGVLAERGKKIREETAVAISASMENQSGDREGTLDITIEQEKSAVVTSGDIDLSAAGNVSEEITVSRNATPKRGRGRPRNAG